MSKYLYECTEALPLPASRPTEPAVQDIFQVLRIRNERNKNYSRNREDHREDYLDSIAKEIKARAGLFKLQSFEIGRLLVDAKALLPHGEFDAWVKEKISLSKSTVINCMRGYKACLVNLWLVD